MHPTQLKSYHTSIHKWVPLLLTFFCLIISFNAFPQDGSDIRYVKTSDLNKTHIGAKVHLDFYNRSFDGTKFDTVLIALTGEPHKFIEHWEHDGYNNWFSRQYLECVDKLDNLKLRLVYSTIVALTKDEITVTSYFNFYDEENNAVTGKAFSKQYTYSRRSIAEVLIKAN